MSIAKYESRIRYLLRQANIPNDDQDDICQEVLTRLWRAKPGEAFYSLKLAYVTSTTRSVLVDKYRKSSRRINLVPLSALTTPDRATALEALYR